MTGTVPHSSRVTRRDDVADQPSRVLIVDDRPENLLAVEAALEPLGLELVSVGSGDAALRALLTNEFSLILLDVQMPGIDGFRTAELIKQRERTRHVPIIFLTAYGNDRANVFEGYSVGAIDYLVKPIDPSVLRSKVQVLIELDIANRRLRVQARELAEARQREERLALESAARTNAERYRVLAEAMPQVVFTSTPDGAVDWFNDRWFELTGQARGDHEGDGWMQAVHVDDRARCAKEWQEAVARGDEFESEYRFRRVDGVHRWHLGRALPIRDEAGHVTSWVGTCTDIDDRRRAEGVQAFLADASAVLGSEPLASALPSVARRVAISMADWCGVYLSDGAHVRRACHAHSQAISRSAGEQFAAASNGKGVAPAVQHVIDTGKAMLIEHVHGPLVVPWTRDADQSAAWQELGFGAAMCVPMIARGELVGALTLMSLEPFGLTDEDLGWAEELGARVAAAVDASRLLEQAESRARAAQVLDQVGDGVVLVDRRGVVRLWNPAAAAILGVPSQDVLGKKAARVVPGWDQVVAEVPIDEALGGAGRTLAIDAGGRELWLSVSGVGSGAGTVYAIRDLTEMRVVEKMKSDFIATVSHELRTPLAAIYGAAATIRRTDLDLDDATREMMLEIIGDQSERLATIINDVLLASRLDAGTSDVELHVVDACHLAQKVVDAAKVHAPDAIGLQLDIPEESSHATALVEADPQHLEQVLANLIDNAVKYSPDGGTVGLAIMVDDRTARLSVHDQGLGIPARDRSRVFEKFYRLDPDMNRGIGGTGLGLYICRELVRHMGGRIWIEDGPDGVGSSFHVELRRAIGCDEGPAKRPASREATAAS